MDNAKLLLQIDNTNLANDDFKNKWVSRNLDVKNDAFWRYNQGSKAFFSSV